MPYVTPMQAASCEISEFSPRILGGQGHCETCGCLYLAVSSTLALNVDCNSRGLATVYMRSLCDHDARLVAVVLRLQFSTGKY